MRNKKGSATMVAILIALIISSILLVKYEKYNTEIQTINKIIKSYPNT